MRLFQSLATSSLTFSLCLGFSSAISAQALQQQYQLAVANDPGLIASQHRHQAVKEYINIADAAFRPVLSAGANQNLNLTTGSGTDSYNASLALSLRLDALYAADSAEASIKQSNFNLQASRQKLLADTIDNYFTIAKQQTQINSIVAQIKSAQQSLARIQKQRQLGLATQVQVADVDNNAQQLNLSLLQAQQKLQEARYKLTLSTGQIVDQELPGINLTTSLPTTESLQFDYWWDLAKQNNLSLRAAAAGVQKAYHDYQQKDAEKYPTGSIAGNHYSYQSDTLTLQITGKLYDGGLNQSLTHQARLTWQASQEDLRVKQRSTKQQLDNMLYNLRNNAQQIILQESLLDTAEFSLAATQKEYQLGVTDLLAVLEAEQKVATTEVNLINARYDQIILQTKLQMLVGSLNDNDLLALDKLLDE
ncbi:MAG: TolC family protein [Gammaproteobacteria bacterium]|jgi:outer membrane protein TolC|nr:TolC family protein [Gammaproteobacteria bacterium]